MNYFFKRYDTREAQNLGQSVERMGSFFLRRAVLEFLKDSTITDKDIIVSHDAKGKPSIKINNEDSPLSISLSHKDYFVVVGIGEPPCSIGVDVEKIRPLSKILVDGFLSQEEFSAFHLCSHEDSSRFLAAVWSYKECVMKSFGLGLRIHPKRINVLGLIHAQGGECSYFLFDKEKISCTVVCNTQYDGYVFIAISVCSDLPTI